MEKIPFCSDCGETMKFKGKENKVFKEFNIETGEQIENESYVIKNYVCPNKSIFGCWPWHLNIAAIYKNGEFSNFHEGYGLSD